MTDEHEGAHVTGSALNIGRAIALALAADGSRIMAAA
jgi:NAD(P)-dependent dehydrogenase (short-subunit alcohol dehydrogenase family)